MTNHMGSLGGQLDKGALGCSRATYDCMHPSALDQFIAAQLKIITGTSKGGKLTLVSTAPSTSRGLAPDIAHLPGIGGKGIAACKRIPADDSAALQLLHLQVVEPAAARCLQSRQVLGTDLA